MDLYIDTEFISFAHHFPLSIGFSSVNEKNTEAYFERTDWANLLVHVNKMDAIFLYENVLNQLSSGTCAPKSEWVEQMDHYHVAPLLQLAEPVKAYLLDLKNKHGQLRIIGDYIGDLEVLQQVLGSVDWLREQGIVWADSNDLLSKNLSVIMAFNKAKEITLKDPFWQRWNLCQHHAYLDAVALAEAHRHAFLALAY